MKSNFALYAGRDPRAALDLLAASPHGHLLPLAPGEAAHAPTFLHFVYRTAEDGAGDLGELRGHLANGNPLLKVLADDPRAVFTVQGPSAYVPNHWLDEAQGVPTSYYSWAQVQVEVTLDHGEEGKLAILDEMLARYQPEGRHPPMSPDDPHWRKMLGAITGLRMAVVQARSRFKYGQNKNAAARERIVEHLRLRGGAEDAAVAGFVERLLRQEQERRAGA